MGKKHSRKRQSILAVAPYMEIRPLLGSLEHPTVYKGIHRFTSGNDSFYLILLIIKIRKSVVDYNVNFLIHRKF